MRLWRGARAMASNTPSGGSPVRLTFDVPTESAEQLTALIQSQTHLLQELGILSLQIQGQDVRLNFHIKHSRRVLIRNIPFFLPVRVSPGAPALGSAAANFLRSRSVALFLFCGG